MKKVDILICLVAVFLGVFIGFNMNKSDRYQIVKTDNSTILLDKKTGLTWRNCWQDEKTKIMAYWEEMEIATYDLENTSVPVGKEKAKQKAIKRDIYNIAKKVKSEKELLKEVRENYPEYDEMNDEELTKAIKSKFPNILK